MAHNQDLYPSRVADRPQVLPRLDPIVYGAPGASAPLTPSLTEQYRQDGYLALENLFSAAEVAALRREAERLREFEARLEPETLITEPEKGSVRSVFKIHEQSKVFAGLACDARLAQIARFLLGDDVYIHQSRLNYKPGFEGKEFQWHSDFETWHVEDGMPRMRAVSMSVLLTENTALNGPTMFIPGSHEHYIACVGETPDDHYKQSLKRQEYGVPDREIVKDFAQKRGVAAPTGPAGAVVIFDCNTLHGSNSNITPFARSNAFFVYNAVSNKLVAPFGPEKPRPDFIAARENTTPVVPVEGAFDEPEAA